MGERLGFGITLVLTVYFIQVRLGLVVPLASSSTSRSNGTSTSRSTSTSTSTSISTSTAVAFGTTRLVSLILQVGTSDMLPVCGEFTWLDVFNLVQLVYTVIALIETCVVLFLFFNKVTLALSLALAQP